MVMACLSMIVIAWVINTIVTSSVEVMLKQMNVVSVKDQVLDKTNVTVNVIH